MSKQVFIPGYQAPLLSTSVRGQEPFRSWPASGLASAHSYQDSFLLSFLSSNKSIPLPRQTDLFSFYILYLDIKSQHFSPLKKTLIGAAAALKWPTPDRP